MANWAIVIGVDKYWQSNACLNGAVRDALRVREWLLSAAGGTVSESNLFLLLDPTASSQIPAGLTYKPATKDNLVGVITDLINRSNGQGERLYFHFSGHGLTSRIDFSDENALVMADFTDQFT